MTRNQSSGLPACALGVLLMVGTGGLGAAQDLTNPLTADQVHCEELQLERLEKRWVVIENDPLSAGNALNPSLLLWRSTAAGGVYSGFGVTDSLGGHEQLLHIREEEQLAFDLVLRQSGDQLNPSRPVLPQGTLVRRGQDSNLIVAGGTARSLTVSMDLAVQVPDPYVPAVPLAVNNLSSVTQPMTPTVPAITADTVGRGISVDDLASACHNAYTSFDQRVFGFIARMLRASECLSVHGCSGADPTAYNITLFRDADPHTYRANVYLYEKTCGPGPCAYDQYGKVALQLLIGWNPDGTLTSGQVTVLPDCQAGQTTECSAFAVSYLALYILPPLFAGHQHQGPGVFSRSPHLDLEYDGSPDNILSAPVDWQALLAATAWNR